MKEVLMNETEIREEIAFEDSCGMNTLLQNLVYFKDKVNVFTKINDKGQNCGYVIRDKITGEDCQL
jgi:hypothetical protein